MTDGRWPTAAIIPGSNRPESIEPERPHSENESGPHGGKSGECGERGERGEIAELWRRRLRHDIRHELGTIIMLASAVAVSDDIGSRSRTRIEQLLGETRWLDHLLRQLEEDDPASAAGAGTRRLRLDELAAEVVAGLRLAVPERVRIRNDLRPAWVHIDAVSGWRALRNVLDNACRVAAGHVEVRVRTEGGWVVVEVDDDGPGFGSGPGGLASLGLGIVHDLVSGYGGRLEIQTAPLGGARVSIVLPAAPAGEERHEHPAEELWR